MTETRRHAPMLDLTLKLPRKYGNTKQRLLSDLRKRYGATVNDFVRCYWPGSKQPHKKARTIERHLRELERDGVVRSVGGASSFRWSEVLWVLPGRSR